MPWRLHRRLPLAGQLLLLLLPALALLSLASLPAFWAISRGAWFSALLFAGIWLLVLAVTVVPVRGRSATGWMIASIAYAFGGLLGCYGIGAIIGAMLNGRIRARLQVTPASIIESPETSSA